MRSRSTPWLLAVLALLLLVSACASYTPMAMPDARENPPLAGIFTGPAGEWVIFRKEG